MAENYVHWRTLVDNNYLRAEMLQPGEKKVLTIKEVKQEEVMNNKGGKSLCPVAYFTDPSILPMVLNKTNCKTIEKLHSSGNIFEWVGKKIQVFATKTSVGGEVVPCLRVDRVVPTGTEAHYCCEVCGSVIDKKTYDASIAKYGKAYCSKECLDLDTKGADVL